MYALTITALTNEVAQCGEKVVENTESATPDDPPIQQFNESMHIRTLPDSKAALVSRM